ncbi:MAG: hypothetical protein K9L56_14175 [Clostridiales bacterium]|nr:hypothetical protein [Clostridiales bacterium]
MLLDYNLILSDGQDLTAISTGNADSTNTIDFGSATPNYGVGNPIWLISQVEVDLTSSGSATLQTKLLDSADDSSWSTVLQTPANAFGDYSAGDYLLAMPLPYGIRRYMKLNYVVATAALTAGTVNSFLTLSPEMFVEDY